MMKNVILHEPSCLEFRFTGKTSVDYENEVEVENLMFNCIEEFHLGKSPEDNLFDKLDDKKLNRYLQNLGKPFGLHFTAKTFRVFRASEMMDDLLNKRVEGENRRR
ncbi:putative DNA topoisomerase [Rosa chinensis]|uniref:Putative DNA topoisomerase n=1 Tax=Rosa chinensis TaxID=74649 RepID=A0A2P6QYE7_ROSCH|nr:putative DNA topoisomerase [Rosa chinensis]